MQNCSSIPGRDLLTGINTILKTTEMPIIDKVLLVLILVHQSVGLLLSHDEIGGLIGRTGEAIRKRLRHLRERDIIDSRRVGRIGMIYDLSAFVDTPLDWQSDYMELKAKYSDYLPKREYSEYNDSSKLREIVIKMRNDDEELQDREYNGDNDFNNLDGVGAETANDFSSLSDRETHIGSTVLVNLLKALGGIKRILRIKNNKRLNINIKRLSLNISPLVNKTKNNKRVPVVTLKQVEQKLNDYADLVAGLVSFIPGHGGRVEVSPFKEKQEEEQKEKTKEDGEMAEVYGPNDYLRQTIELELVRQKGREKRAEAHRRKFLVQPVLRRTEDKAVEDYNANDMENIFRGLWNEHGFVGNPFRWTLKEKKFAKEMIKVQGQQVVVDVMKYVFENWQEIMMRYRISGAPSMQLIYAYRRTWTFDAIGGMPVQRTFAGDYSGDVDMGESGWGDD
jgi:hypothetical protein